MSGVVAVRVELLCACALVELNRDEHALTVAEITGLVSLASAFRLFIVAAHLRERLRIAQSTLPG